MQMPRLTHHVWLHLAYMEPNSFQTKQTDAAGMIHAFYTFSVYLIHYESVLLGLNVWCMQMSFLYTL